MTLQPTSVWTRVVLVLSATVLIGSSTQVRTGAVPSTTGKLFLYWLSGQFFQQHTDHVNATFIYNTAQLAAEFQALPAGTKMIVGPYGVLAPNQCGKAADWAQQWAAWSAALAPYLPKIEAFLLADEPDLRAINDCFQDDPSYESRQNKAMMLMTELSNIVKTTTTGGANWSQVKTWVNYGAEFRNNGVNLAQNVDLNSFDCYGPFTNCGGSGYSIPQLVDIMAAKLPNPATQKIVLVADASCHIYHGIGRRTHESELFVRALEYWQLAKTHPRVHGIVGFIWDWQFPDQAHLANAPDPIHNITASPGLTTLYRNIGLNLLTNAIPTFSRITAPAECLIPVGSGACSVNLSWTLATGPYVGAYARLAGRPDVVSGPFCAGIAACTVAAVANDYIVELREFWWDPNSRLIDAKAVKVRYANGTPTGQITHVPTSCDADAQSRCLTALVANVQNAPSATFFIAGAPSGFCTGRVTMCANTLTLAPGQYPFTVQLRASTTPTSPLLDQRTFTLTVLP